MPFPESVKKEASEKAHYRCVLCHEFFIDIHHITPESEDGANTLDNAVALCARCHRNYGNNPDLRKQIKGHRDLWYDICSKRYSNWDSDSLKKLNDLYDMAKNYEEDRKEYKTILSEIKATLSGTISSTASNVGGSTSLPDIAAATSGYLLGTPSNTIEVAICNDCGIGFTVFGGTTKKCPKCGKLIR